MTTGNHNNLCGGGSAGAWPPQTPKGARRQRVVGYVRVAAESPTNSRSSLDTQAARIRTLAEAEGLELVAVIADSGESAHNLSRSGLQRLLAAVNAGQVQAVIVPDLYRVARNTGDLRVLVDRFTRCGVILVAGTGLFGPPAALGLSESRKD